MKNNNQYSLFIGRWQCLHNGHMHIFNTEIEKGNKLLIAIRDVLPDDSNPFSANQVKTMLEIAFNKHIKTGIVRIMIIPDIKSVNYGRGVGYEINEIIPNKDIAAISATQIRKAIRDGNDEWKTYVPEELVLHLPRLFKNAACYNKNCFFSSFFSRSVLKALTYRMMGTATTIIISYCITKRIDMSLTIGGVEVLIKICNYVLHEYAWKFFSKK